MVRGRLANQQEMLDVMPELDHQRYRPPFVRWPWGAAIP
jgi:hypothetical protein